MNLVLINYSLAPWTRVLLEKLTSSQLVMKFPAFYGTRRFIIPLFNFCNTTFSKLEYIHNFGKLNDYWITLYLFRVFTYTYCL